MLPPSLSDTELLSVPFSSRRGGALRLRGGVLAHIASAHDIWTVDGTGRPPRRHSLAPLQHTSVALAATLALAAVLVLVTLWIAGPSANAAIVMGIAGSVVGLGLVGRLGLLGRQGRGHRDR